MADISIQCTGADAAQIARYREDVSDTVYIGTGETVSLDGTYLAQVSVAETGTPELKLVNDSAKLRLEVFSVRAGRVTRVRPLMPQRSRAVTLGAKERFLLIPTLLDLVTTRRKLK